MNWNGYDLWFKKQFQQEIKDFISFIIHELDVDYTARILEIGSGAGWVSLDLARRMPDTEIVGIESNVELVAIADQNKIQEQAANVHFVKNDHENLKTFANQSFDCIIAFKGLRQWNFPLPVFNEINRILKKDGAYAITDYRKDLKWLARASLWFTGKTMLKDFHSHWKEMIINTYSLDEIVKLLLRTKLQDWKIRTTLFDFLIYKTKVR